MPEVPASARVLVSAVGEYYGQRTITSWLYKVASIDDEVDDITLFNAMHVLLTNGTGLLTKFRACCPDDGVWVGVAAWYQVLGPVRFRKVARNIDDGTYEATSVTANLQASITRVGAYGNRKNVGGIRVPMPSAESDAGKITAEYGAVLQTLATQMTQNIVVASPVATLVPQVGVPGYDQSIPPQRIPVTQSVDLADAIPQDTTRVLRRRTLRVGI